jgi:hypothetical protein
MAPDTMTPTMAREILEDAEKHRDLTAWERNFVRDMLRDDDRPLTEARIGVIRKIEQKIYRTG